MTIRFAAAPTASPALSRTLSSSFPTPRAANDNWFGESDNNMLREALLHFASFGLSAADEARKEAEKAFFAGNRSAYLRWLGVCRTLDRRMANAFAAQVETAAP